MKTSLLKYILFTGFCIFMIACSVRKDTFVSRNSHALSTKYNILYNGGIALDKGIEELKTTYADNYWEVLPIERMQPGEKELPPGQTATPNANFARAEEKATKAIQKHSMNIDGTEKNPQMDEAYLMLGKARYYDKRYLPALDAFNYVLYKYPKSDKIYEAKIWREKTNMRLENDVLAVQNLEKLLKEIKFKDQIFADANATMAQAYLNVEQKDSAIAKLRLATKFTKSNEEKARYRFILAQLYERMNEPDSAFATYQSVIDMKRKSPRVYVIQAHAGQAKQYTAKNGDSIAFLKKYKKLLEDRENRPFLGVINHQMALFYEKYKNDKQAIKFYNASLNQKASDPYLTASNYRNLGEIYFNQAKYVTAGNYYDSTLVQLRPRTREYNLIKKKRENLVDVIKYEGIARVNDSILTVLAMSGPERVAYYEKYIDQLKKEDEARRKEAEKLAKEQEAMAASGGVSGDDSRESVRAAKARFDETDNKPANAALQKMDDVTRPRNLGTQGQAGQFYFYNEATVAYGIAEFKKKWGNRALAENWRTTATKSSDSDKPSDDDADDDDAVADAKSDKPEPRYTPEFYIGQLPTTQKEADNLAKERNFAYYQLGVIYKEKFKEYKRAADKLEKLLDSQPEERLVLPSMYHLYKIYEIIDKDKAVAMKVRIIDQYPDSRYAQILSNTNSESVASLSPEAAYNGLFKRYNEGDYKNTLVDLETAIDQYTGDEIVPKLEILKARTIGKLRGVEEYKKALNFVALNYPNSAEGKEAEALLGTEVPALAALEFSSSETSNWKILYLAKDPNEKATKNLVDKVKKFLGERDWKKLKMSFDVYTEEYNFVVIHGMVSEENAKGIAGILKDFKEYKVPDVPIIISGQNYEIVQMKKNIGDYLANPTFNTKSVTDQLPAKQRTKAATPPPPAKRAEREQKDQMPAVPTSTMPPGANPGMPGMPNQGGKTEDKSKLSQPPSLGAPPTGSDQKR
ncbi:Gliding motility protein [Flavobacterium longum]|uniref:type IX secretion system periplasmic lipoprotein PorW/SprE n=1 Tax=Flavobacterium longum TaxID=1299340 RepID=UPI0039E7F468